MARHRSHRSRGAQGTDLLHRLAASWPPMPLETPYSTLELKTEGTQVTLLLDGTESSCLDLADPTHLLFDYHVHMDILARTYFPQGAVDSPRPRALHLGACGCALPQAWTHSFAGWQQTAVEIDPVLAQNVRSWFNLPSAPALKIRCADAAAVIAEANPSSADIIVRDAFIAGHVPDSLAGPEFYGHIARAVRPGGLYLANIASTTSPEHSSRAARADSADLRSVGLEHIVCLADPKVWSGRKLGNIVLAASTRPCERAEIQRAIRGIPNLELIVP